MPVRDMLLAWLWWQAWNGPDLRRRVQSATSYARVAGYSRDAEWNLSKRAIFFWPADTRTPGLPDPGAQVVTLDAPPSAARTAGRPIADAVPGATGG